MRRWASCQQYVLVRFLSAGKSAGEAAPRGTVQLKDQVDGIYDAKAATSRGQSRSNEMKVCLQQWTEFESRWNRLAPSCVIERITQARSLNATCIKRHCWGRYAGAGLPVRFKHMRAGSNVLTEQEKSTVNLNGTAEPLDVEKTSRSRSTGAAGKQDGGEDGKWDARMIENADMKQIACFFSASSQISCALEIIPILLQRIATLQRPILTAQHGNFSSASREAGDIVRALLSYTHQHLASLDMLLLADIFCSAGNLTHLHGMQLWFPSGGAGGMGIRSLLLLATNSEDLPPAHVARVLGALGRMGTGEQGMDALDRGLGQRALQVAASWDADMLLEALQGLMSLQGATNTLSKDRSARRGKDEARKAGQSGGGMSRSEGGWRGGGGGGGGAVALAHLVDTIINASVGKLGDMTLEQLCLIIEAVSKQKQRLPAAKRKGPRGKKKKVV